VQAGRFVPARAHKSPLQHGTGSVAAILTDMVGIAISRYYQASMDDLYRDYILEHYRRPHNFGVIENADATYEGANPLCGDRITLMIGVTDGIVDRVGFTGRGCAISQASASLLTDEIKGKPLVDVARFRADDLLDLLGIDISPARLKCAMLSHDSLQHVLGDLGEPARVPDVEAAGAAAPAAAEPRS
jgi:nitrogen fixation protein NifU and related proteins